MLNRLGALIYIFLFGLVSLEASMVGIRGQVVATQEGLLKVLNEAGMHHTFEKLAKAVPIFKEARQAKVDIKEPGQCLVCSGILGD